MIICNHSIIKADGIHDTPSIVIEILSPSTSARDRSIKFRRYQSIGVQEYWIIDLVVLSLERYVMSEDGLYNLIIYYHPSSKALLAKDKFEYCFITPILSDLIIDLNKVFRDTVS